MPHSSKLFGLHPQRSVSVSNTLSAQCYGFSSFIIAFSLLLAGFRRTTMQLSELIIDPRVRSSWSAIDLGTLLGRKFWLRGFTLYLSLALPAFFIALTTSQFTDWLPYLLLWWFKPIFERPFLYCLSRELFGEKSSYLSTLKNFKHWLWPGFLSVITLRRLSTNRGMYAPVSLLERPSASEYGKRTSILGATYSGGSTWLTIAIYHFEGIILIALLTLFAFLFPDHLKSAFSWLETSSANNSHEYVFLLQVVVMALVAPLYCAAGFMLYICRRIELEGWDIEICFRDWVQNQVSKANEDDLATARRVN